MLIFTKVDLEKLMKLFGSDINLKDLIKIIQKEISPQRVEFNGKIIYIHDAREYLVRYHPDYRLN